MIRFNSTARDDDNDTRLFDALEEHILEHYPNPERVGCLDHELLWCLVETPEKLDLGDPKYLHVFRCAECTRALKDLRRMREARIRKEVGISRALSSTGIQAMQTIRRPVVTAASRTHMFVIRIIEKLRSIFR